MKENVIYVRMGNTGMAQTEDVKIAMKNVRHATPIHLVLPESWLCIN